MTLPSFLVVGAGRSGTTSLHAALRQHPEVFVPARKSPNFFATQEPLPTWERGVVRAMARSWVRDAATYEALFERAGAALAIGEVSPVYLQARSVPEAVHARCPDVRIVAILRDPAERAHAHWLGRRRDGLDTRADFAAVVAEELERGLPDHVAFGSYVGCGRYHHFLRGFTALFPPERVRVYLYDDLCDDAAGVMRSLYAFLGVDPSFEPDLRQRHGATGEIHGRAARRTWTATAGLRTALRPHLPAAIRDAARPFFLRHLDRPACDPEVRSRIIEALRSDIEALQDQLDRDLSAWLRTHEDPSNGGRGDGARRRSSGLPPSP